MKLTAFLAVVGTAGWLFFHDQVQSKLRSTVQEKCSTALAGTGIEASIGGAQFIDGQGMLLSNMQAHAPNMSLTAYETFLSMKSHTTDLVTGNCKVDGIELRRVKLGITRSSDGTLDLSTFSKLATAIENLTAGTQKCLVPITMLDSQVRLIDQLSGIEKTFSDINIRIVPVHQEGRTILYVDAKAASVEVPHIVLKGYVDPELGDWRANLMLNNAILGSDLIALIPQKLQQQLGGIKSLHSRIDGFIKAEGNWRKNEIGWFEGSGTVGQIVLQHERLPSEVRGASARFSLSPDGVTFSDIKGQMGTSPFAAHFELIDLIRPQAWRLAGQIQQFKLDGTRETLQAMPASSKQFLHDFQPNGLFDIQFNVQFDGSRIRKTVNAQISQLAFNFNKFPYPMSNCKGTAQWVDDQITYDLKSESRDQVLSARGFVNNPGDNTTWRCNLKVDRGQVPFDPKLQTALDANPPFARVVRAFNAHGWIAGKGTIEKRIPGGEVEKRFDIDVVDLTMRHARFPYTIENVNGKITSINKSFRFEQLSGTDNSGVGKIRCNGTWNPQEGLNAHYVCNDIELNEQLRRALRPELKDVWDGFRPRGTVETMTVNMTMAPDKKDCNLVLYATLNGHKDGLSSSDLSIYPTWFPYELNNLAGTLVVGNGAIKLRNFKGEHGRTEVYCDGNGSYSPDGWHMSLANLLTSSLRADEPLLQALPESLARPIVYMKFDGLLNVRGTMTLAGQYRKPAPQFAGSFPTRQPGSVQQASYAQPVAAVTPLHFRPTAPKVSMGWDLEFVMNKAKLFLGIPVENVFGMFKLIGQYDGENVECRGSVDLDSLTIYDAQITKVRGPIWFDNYQALAGNLINQLSSSRSTSPSITGEMYGGLVNLDAAISSDKEGRFFIHTTLADGNLKTLCKEFSPNLENIEGHTFAALRMQGDASGIQNCKGSGQIKLRNAKIYEFPPVMRILKIMHGGRANDVAFDKGDIFFSVNGENIDVNRMEFNGDAVSIIGNGRMNMNHDLDLNFYTVMGRNLINVPLLSELYRRSSQKFMWINIGGTCQNPKMTKKILPELNDSLRQLFQKELR